MKNIITENEIESIALSYLQNLEYGYVCGADIAPDGEHPERQYSEVVLTAHLRDKIDKLNTSITQEACEVLCDGYVIKGSNQPRKHIIINVFLCDCYVTESKK